MEKVRVLRILEYVGDRKWVENTLNHNNVPSNGVKYVGENVIKSSTVDQFPEIASDPNRYVYTEESMSELKRVVNQITDLIRDEKEITLTLKDAETIIEGLKNSYVGLSNYTYANRGE